MLAGRLAPWVAMTKGVAWQRIDIVSWKSDAFQQAKREFGIHGIPYVRVYGMTGEFLGAVSGGDIAAIQDLVRKGL